MKRPTTAPNPTAPPDAFATRVQDELATLEAQQVALRQQIAPLQAALNALKAQCAGLQAYLHPPAKLAPHKTLIERIAVVLRDAPQGLGPKGIRDRLLALGDTPIPIVTVQAALSYHAEFFPKVHRGRYVLRDSPHGPVLWPQDGEA